MSYYSSYIHSYSHFSYPIIFFSMIISLNWEHFITTYSLWHQKKFCLNSYFPTYMSHHFSESLFLDLWTEVNDNF